ncbi:hypothetical protein KGM48_02715 [Patescibacteria group bacterium]|nr:hypothetical protein [Patescibacteria group bacterium]
MRKKHGWYEALVMLPDRLYPFQTEVGGRLVRGVRSYNARLARYEREHGPGRYGYGLEAYRQLFHLTGSILFLAIAAYLSQTFFSSTGAIYVFLAIAVLFISFQEFYLHRRMYQQLWKKGIIDWLAWCLPFGIYLFSHFR